MLTAHIQFVVNGMISLLAGLMLRTSLSVAGKRASAAIVWAHISAWFLCFSEVAAAIWGGRKTVPIAAAEAGAAGAAPWQESLVLVCHLIPALLFAVLACLLWSVTARFRPCPNCRNQASLADLLHRDGCAQCGLTY